MSISFNPLLKVPKFAIFGHFWTRIYQLDVIWHLKLSPGMCLLWPFTTFFYLGTVATPVSWNKIAWKRRRVRSLKIRMFLLLLLCFASAEFLTEVNSTFPEFCFEDSVISCVLVRPNPTSLWNWLILFLSFLIIPVTTHLRSQLRMATRQSSRLMRRRGISGATQEWPMEETLFWSPVLITAKDATSGLKKTV